MDALETLQNQANKYRHEYQKAKKSWEKERLSICLHQIEENINFLKSEKQIILPKKEEFSYLSKLDKKTIIEEIRKTKTPYRYHLSFDEKIGFGIEIETVNIFLKELEKIIKEKRKSKTLKKAHTVEKEMSVCHMLHKERAYQGGEVITPILHNDRKTWRELEVLYTILRENHVKISDKCSTHVHVGAEIIEYDERKLKQFLKLFIAYEHVLFRFFLGDYFQVRNLAYANPLRQKLGDKVHMLDTMTLSELQKTIAKISSLNIENFDPSRRYQKNTIEFRLGNGTLKAEIAQNYIMTSIHLLESVKNKEKGEAYLAEKLRNIQKDPYSYTDLHLEDAFVLCDLIFETNEDKIYFLKQYLHNLETISNKGFPTPISGQAKEMMLK